MKRAILATLGLAVAMVLGVTLLSGTAFASDPDNNDVITIASPQNNTAVAVGNTFTFTLAVTQSTDPPLGYKAIQWEVAYPNNSSFVSATYNCQDPSGINFPAETETQPVEAPLIPGVNNLGGGANCASLSGTFNGTHATGVFVTVTLMCNSVLNSSGNPGDAVVVRPQNEAANPANDTFFGTTLLDKDANIIDTALAPQVPVPGFGTQAAVFYSCAAPVDYHVTKTPASQNVAGDAPNNVVNQTIAIANPDSAAHAVFLADALPAGVTVTNVVPTNGSCTVGPAPAAPGPGPTPPYYGPGPNPAAGAGQIVCTGMAPAGGSLSAVLTYTVTPSQDCSAPADGVQGGPADATTAESNPADNAAGAIAVVDCPVLSVAKNCVDNDGPPTFVGDTITCTISVSNDGPANGSTAHNVTVTDAVSGGTCTANCGPYAVGDIPAGGSSAPIVTVITMPANPGQSCDTASATQDAPGTGASSQQVCFTALSKFPNINGFAKDTGVAPDPGFTFTIGNLFLCKPLGAPITGVGVNANGAGQTGCGTFDIAELVQEPTDLDSCADDDDADGLPCAGVPGTPFPFQNPADGNCQLHASDYIPGVTKIDCNGGEVGEGLGAAEFQVKFDDKIFQSPTFSCDGVLDDTGRLVQTQVSVITENWVQFGCVTKDPAHPQSGPPGTCTAPLPDGSCPGPDISAGAVVLGHLHLAVQPDLLSRIRPAKENGVVSNLLDENCEKADTLGQPFNEVQDPNTGFVSAPSGGLSQDCKDAALTIRMLEGDINLDCTVNVLDDQSEAFRYGQFFGQLNYNRFFDLEPNISPDFDIDIKDLQTVFGRNGSTCANPIPIQNPNPTTPDP